MAALLSRLKVELPPLGSEGIQVGYLDGGFQR